MSPEVIERIARFDVVQAGVSSDEDYKALRVGLIEMAEARADEAALVFQHELGSAPRSSVRDREMIERATNAVAENLVAIIREQFMGNLVQHLTDRQIIALMGSAEAVSRARLRIVMAAAGPVARA